MTITTDEAILRQHCEDVLPDEVEHLRELLEKELKHSEELGAKGIGLAAIQIGIPKRFAIVRISSELSVDLVNCKVETGYDLTLFDGEGCLSYPGRFEKTMRHNEIYVTNNLTYPHSFICTGLMAYCTAHEIDHFNNRLLPDFAIKQELSKKQKRKENKNGR